MIYFFGLVVASLYILFGIDDLIWDIVFFFKSRFRKKDQDRIPMEELDNTPPKLLAVIVAAWKEDAVLYDVISNLIETAQYPKSMYHIFIGIYPNDNGTINVVKKLETEYPNVHGMFNANPGPTTKADNINQIFHNIKTFEAEMGWEFSAFIVHDSEDIVHPYEFKMENYLIEKYNALQFPVFPLQQKPKFRNIFSNMTVGTYADEFGENHFHVMVARNLTGAFVPSAGTGFALSRRLIDEIGFDHIFPEDSLTEDYKLALTLKMMGHHVHYVLESVERLNNEGKMVRDFVSTRSRFPSTFRAAIKQKSRWIHGITMQSFRFRNIFARNDMTFVQRYSLYRDWKAKFGNLMNFFGYIVFIYFIVSLIFSLPIMYPMWSFSWYLCVALTVMMLERQLLRAAAIKNVYGWRSMFIASFLPPLLPIRLVWGNIINLVATLRAWKMRFTGNANRKKKNTKQRWDKTDHEFLDKEVLKRYHRNIGDILLEKKFVTTNQLKDALKKSREEQIYVGKVLKEKNQLSEDHLLNALANVQHTIVFPLNTLETRHKVGCFDFDLLAELNAFPILEMKNSFALAISDESPLAVREKLEQACNKKIEIVYSKPSDIRDSLRAVAGGQYTAGSNNLSELCSFDNINGEQALLAILFGTKLDKPAKEVLFMMGLTRSPQEGGGNGCSLYH
jgi:adsorption protein B